MILLTKMLEDISSLIKGILDEFKEVKETMKGDIKEFKGEMLQKLENQNANIAQAQTHNTDLV